MGREKILFFIKGNMPTQNEQKQADRIKGVVCFRNLRFVDNDANLEECDGVAGSPPKKYKDVFGLLDQKKPGIKEEPKKPVEQKTGVGFENLQKSAKKVVRWDKNK